jgi:hypothetical protein
MILFTVIVRRLKFTNILFGIKHKFFEQMLGLQNTIMNAKVNGEPVLFSHKPALQIISKVAFK